MNEQEQRPPSSLSKKQLVLLSTSIVLLLGCIGVLANINSSFTAFKSSAPAAAVVGASTVLPSGESTDVPLDLSALTPETYSEIMEKIKNTPNSAIKATIDSGVSVTTFYYSIGPDPFVPGSEDAFIFEIESETYRDENGAEYPEGPAYRHVQMRDTDFDALPDDYWTDDFGDDIAYRVLTPEIPDSMYYATMWNVGIAYFRTHILKE